jgi:hypothetical protein
VCVQVARRIGFEHKDNPITVRTQRNIHGIGDALLVLLFATKKRNCVFRQKKKKKRNCVDERKSYMESNKPPFRCGQAGFVGITRQAEHTHLPAWRTRVPSAVAAMEDGMKYLCQFIENRTL